MGKRRLPKLVTVLLVAALIGACSGNGGDEQAFEEIPAVNPYGGDPASEGEPVRGGTMLLGTDREPVSFDPLMQNANAAALAVYDNLLKMEPGGEPQPYLAESM